MVIRWFNCLEVIISHKHVSIDYIACKSGLREWNAGWKVLFSIFIILTVIIADSWYVSLFTMLYMSYVIVKLGRVKFYDYLLLIKIPLVFIVLGAIAVILQFGRDIGDSILHISLFGTYIYVTNETLFQGCNLFIKSFAAISGLYFMSLSTPMGEIISVCRKARVPDLFLELMYFIYRYFFLFIDINRKQNDAVASRLGYADFKTSIRTFSSVSANLLVMALRKSGDFYDAMESRGYDGRISFLTEKKKRTRGQTLCMLLYIAGVIIINITANIKFL